VMLLKPFQRVGLTRRELLVVYAVLLVAAPVMSYGILYWMLPKSIIYYYLARANPAWEAEFLPLIPTWFSPSDSQAVESFFLGHASVPWDLWLLPLSAWLSFAIALFGAVACLLAILQPQWVRNERLAYPLAQIPLMVVEASGDRGEGVAKLSSNRLLWWAVGLTFLLSFLGKLAQFFPSVPHLTGTPVVIIPWQKVGPLAGLGSFEVGIWPWMIALAYLIPKELSFSCWFFWIVRLGLTVMAISAGGTPQLPEEWWSASFPAPYYQGTGALLAMGLWVMWTARQHLFRVIRKAITFRSRDLDNDEPVAYRPALLGFVICLAWMIWFLHLAGCRWLFGVLLAMITIGYYIMWARIRAETGLGFLAFPLDVRSAITGSLGTSMLRPREIILLSSARWAYSPGEGASFDTTTSNLAETLKIGDAAGINLRRLTAAASSIFANLRDPTPLNPGALIGIAAGVVSVVFLAAMRLRFHWWPFHPIGYLAANCWGWHWYALLFFAGWLCKHLVIRYGGLNLYRQTTYLAVGLIIGDVLNGGLWALVLLLTHGRVGGSM